MRNMSANRLFTEPFQMEFLISGAPLVTKQDMESVLEHEDLVRIAEELAECQDPDMEKGLDLVRAIFVRRVAVAAGRMAKTNATFSPAKVNVSCLGDKRSLGRRIRALRLEESDVELCGATKSVLREARRAFRAVRNLQMSIPKNLLVIGGLQVSLLLGACYLFGRRT